MGYEYDYELLFSNGQIRWTTAVSSWPLGLLDRHNTVTNPHDWTVLGSTEDVEAKGCEDLPAVELESLAVSISLLLQVGNLFCVVAPTTIK